MRRSSVAIIGAAGVIALAGAAPAQAPVASGSPTAGKGAPRGARSCRRHYTRKEFRRETRKVMHAPVVTASSGASLHRMIRCAANAHSAHLMRVHLAKYRAWRRSYAGRWRIAAEGLSPYMVRLLGWVRACETGDRSIWGSGNYRYQGAYLGAYQYTASTWGRAGGTGAVWLASKDEQDVRTARFLPSHVGEWPRCGPFAYSRM